MTDHDVLQDAIQNLTARVSVLSDQLAAVERDRAYRASLPKDDDAVAVRTGKGLFAQEMWVDFASIKNQPGLKFDAASNCWRCDSLPDSGFSRD